MAAPETSDSGQAPAESATAFGPSDSTFNDDYDAPYEAPEPKPEPKADETPTAAKPEAKKEPESAKKAEPKADEPAAAKHNADLVDIALDLGASQEWIDSQTPAQLRAAVRAEVARRREAPAPKKEEPKDDVLEFEVGGKKHALKGEDFDPTAFALLKALHAQNQTNEQRFKQLSEDSDRRHLESQREAARAAFEELGEFYAGADDTDGGRRRMAIAGAARVLKTDSPTTAAKKIKEMAALFGGGGKPPAAKPAKAAEPEPEPAADATDRGDGRNEKGQFVPAADAQTEIDQWRSGNLPAPTDRQSPPSRLAPREQGVKNLANSMRKLGISPNGA